MGGVDIGTEWNLKSADKNAVRRMSSVDIGTEWNLKCCNGCDDRLCCQLI